MFTEKEDFKIKTGMKLSDVILQEGLHSPNKMMFGH